MEKTNKFIHFGCWNNLNIKKNKQIGCLNNVMTQLNQYLKSDPQVNFIIIAGDNYYPDKNLVNEKKQKIIYPDLMNNGFNKLPTNLPIYMILGNHDLETNTKKQNLFIENTSNPEKGDCAIINYQKQIVNNNPSKNIDYFLFKEKLLNNNTLLLMIDTSMYSLDVDKFLPCYNIFLERNFIDSNELIEYQNNLIMEAITSNYASIKNIIISGHQPITGIKYEEPDETKGETTGEIEILNDIPYFRDLLKKMYEKMTQLTGENTTRYYYLCADLHLYQKGKIILPIDETNNMVITQYVVGTGGTKLDNDIPREKIGQSFESDGIRYLLEDCIKTCGFLECVIEEEPMFKFISFSNGGKRKTTHKRSRKINRKTRKIGKRKTKNRKRITLHTNY